MGYRGPYPEWKDFYSRAEYEKAYNIYYYELRKEHFKKLSRENYKKYPERNKNAALQRKFGISLDYYNRLLKDQKNLCAICKNPDSTQRLAVDHCHNSGRVRGLLCGSCNKGLGYFKDNIDYLHRAKEYLC